MNTLYRTYNYYTMTRIIVGMINLAGIFMANLDKQTQKGNPTDQQPHHVQYEVHIECHEKKCSYRDNKASSFGETRKKMTAWDDHIKVLDQHP